MKDLGVDEKKILEWILKELNVSIQDMDYWIAFGNVVANLWVS